MSDKQRHQLLGLITLFLYGVVVMICLGGQFNRWEGIASACLRSAIFLSLTWLAWDDLLRVPKWLGIVGVVIFVGVVIRPRLIPYMLMIVIPTWLIMKFLRFIAAPLPPPRNRPWQ